MTLREVLRAAMRRWYVLLLVIAIAAAGSVWLQRDGGTYATRTSVVFTLPGEVALLPENGATDERVIAFASAVAQELNGGRPAPTYATADAPAYGAGVREGVWVGLPNHGGQWVDSFGLAQIEIQIVGRTEEYVESTQQALLQRVIDTAEARQAATGAAESELITASVVPLTTRVDHIEASRSAVILAFAGIGIAALVVGMWMSVQLERFSHRRRRASRARASVHDGMRIRTE